MDVHQAAPQLAHLRQRHGNVVHEHAALARGGDDAREGRLVGIVEVVLLEEGLQTEPRQAEGSLDGAVARRVLHGRAVVLAAQQQPEGSQQD